MAPRTWLSAGLRLASRGRLAAGQRVQLVRRQTQIFINQTFDVGVRHRAIRWAGPAREGAAADVANESRGETLDRERTRPAADVDLDARQLSSLLGVVRRLAEGLGGPGRALRDRSGHSAAPPGNYVRA